MNESYRDRSREERLAAPGEQHRKALHCRAPALCQRQKCQRQKGKAILLDGSKRAARPGSGPNPSRLANPNPAVWREGPSPALRQRQATANGADDPGLSSALLRTRLSATLWNNVIIGALKTQLRAKVLSELRSSGSAWMMGKRRNRLVRCPTGVRSP